jgi:perosamine synthetase
MVTIIPSDDGAPDKFELQRRLREKGVDTRPFFSRLSKLEAYQNAPESARFLPPQTKGEHLARCGINLPSGYGLTESDVEAVCDALRKSLI